MIQIQNMEMNYNKIEESVAKWLRHEPAELEIGGSNPPTLFLIRIFV